MSEELVRYREAGRAAWLTMDSPGNRNALSSALLAQLRSGVERALSAPGVRVVVLGHSGATFCAGADLREQEEARAQSGRSPGAGGLVPLLRSLLECPKPVVAGVGGAVRGGGMGLVAAADLTLATVASSFAFSEVRLGVVPAVIAPPVLAKVGRSAALELFLGGRTFGAEEARGFGLVNRVVGETQLEEALEEAVGELALGAPGAQAEVKRVISRVPGLGWTEAFEEMTSLSEEHFSSAEAKEGIAAFRTRRRPRWAE